MLIEPRKIPTSLYLLLGVLLVSTGLVIADGQDNENANENGGGECIEPPNEDPLACCCSDGNGGTVCQDAFWGCWAGWSCPQGCSGPVNNCPDDCPSDGACCYGDITCDDSIESDQCDTNGGDYQGDGSTCGAEAICCLADATGVCGSEQCCSNEPGATFQAELSCGATANDVCCCLADGVFLSHALGDCCEHAGGESEVTSDGSCGEVGACCLGDGGCYQTAEACCPGVFLGPDTECGDAVACCVGDPGSYTCVETTNACCSPGHGGAFYLPDETCEPNPCGYDDPIEACCLGNGDCLMLPPDACVNSYGGTPQGSGSTCTPNPCKGACCHGDGTCTEEAEENCQGPNDTYQGAGTSCDDYGPTIDSGPDHVTVCEGDDATFTVQASGQGTLHYTWKRNGVPIAGNDSSSLTLEDILVDEHGDAITCEVRDDCGTVETASAYMSVWRVISVSWVEYATHSTPLSTCPNNGGLKMLPGRLTFEDVHTADRRKIRMRAQIDPPYFGQPVHFKVFDVDDPFDQNNPNMEDVTIIDDNTAGPDNRIVGGGSDPAVVTEISHTDSNGVADVIVEVSMQPGNNYRFVATCSEDNLALVTQADADANTPPANTDVHMSEMLTVWRKVWLELDSMEAGNDIIYSGTIDEIFDHDPHTSDGKVELAVPDINDDGRFEGGVLEVSSTGRSYGLIDNVDASGDDYYITAGLVSTSDLNRQATVTDDDLGMELPLKVLSDMQGLNDKYENAYVEFEEDPSTLVHYSDHNTFIATLSLSSSEVADFVLEKSNIAPTADYWSVTVVTGHQSHHTVPDIFGNLSNATTVDFDPDSIYHAHLSAVSGLIAEGGDQSLILGSSAATENACVMHREVFVDIDRFDLLFRLVILPAFDQTEEEIESYLGTYRTPDWLLSKYVSHEIGHVFGLVHDDAEGTLMEAGAGSDGDGLSLRTQDSEFNAEQLDIIRSSDALSSHEY